MKKILILLLAVLSLAALPLTAAGSTGEEISLPIVMYHHISKRSACWNDYVVSPEEFESDMAYLEENGWHSVGVRELLDWYDGKFEMPEKPFMLTFDDGFESTLAYAEPVVAAHGFNGVLAVIGSVCEKFTECGEHDPELSNLSWEDAAAMAKRGVFEIQCHTWDLHGLGARVGCGKMKGESVRRYSELLSADLVKFQREAAENGLDTVPSIAYPYGAFCSSTTEIVKSLGFRAAFTCDGKVNVLRGDREELYRLGRYNRPHGASSEKFFSVWEKTVDKAGQS